MVGRAKDLNSAEQADRVLIGISGGIDSAVAATLLKTQGLDVTAVFVQVCDETSKKPLGEFFNTCKGASCCLHKDAENAKRICAHLDIPLHIINASDAYRADIIDYVASEYLSYRKPNPCAKCIVDIKLAAMRKKAKDLGIHYLATGHYAKVIRNADGTDAYLVRGSDRENEQSYYLWALDQDLMSRLLMPLGDLLKANVRKMAQTFQLPVEEQKPSQTLCFVGDGGYKPLLRRTVPERYRPSGPIVTTDGMILGRHDGMYEYSVGDTISLGMGTLKQDIHTVLGFDQHNIALIVSKETRSVSKDKTTEEVLPELLKKGILVGGCNWIGTQDFTKGLVAKAQIASGHEPADCLVTALGMNTAIVEFTQPQGPVSNGQTIVFYQEEVVIGGGWIEGVTDPTRTRLRASRSV